MAVSGAGPFRPGSLRASLEASRTPCSGLLSPSPRNEASCCHPSSLGAPYTTPSSCLVCSLAPSGIPLDASVGFAESGKFPLRNLPTFDTFICDQRKKEQA